DRAAALIESRLGEGDGERVAVLSRNSADFLTIHFACIRAGAVFVPLNWRLAPAELRVLTEDCSPRLLFLDPDFAEAGAQIAEGGSIRETLPLNLEDLEPLLAGAPERPMRPRPPRADQPSTLLYTSGTTGRPKGVIVTE